MSNSPEYDLAWRVEEYARALALGDLYCEPGEAIDELGQPLRPRRRTTPLVWASEERRAAMRVHRGPDDAALERHANTIAEPVRDAPDWSEVDALVARLAARKLREAA